MAIFTEIIQLTWFGFDDSEDMFKLANQILFFSGHLDIEKPIQVKQFQNWQKMRHWMGCPKFWYSLIVAKFKQVTHTSLAQIVSITYCLVWFRFLGVIMIRKNNNFTCRSLLGLRIVKTDQICSVISVARAISEDSFDHSKAKSSPISKVLTLDEARNPKFHELFKRGFHVWSQLHKHSK